MGFSTRTERWSEDALLSDGRVVKVEREVGYTFQFVSGDEASMKLFASWPDRFWIRFKHPDNKETIAWQGEQHYHPVLLDFVNGVPYLVVYGRSSKKTEAIYGCPELPYTYLKYEPGFIGKWSPVPVEKAPDVLRKANLSPNYPDFGNLGAQGEAIEAGRRGGRDRRDMSPTDIQGTMSSAEHNSGGFFQRVIPRTYEEWNYVYKNNHRNERRQGDCRPPLKPLADLPLPVPTDIKLEVVETSDQIFKDDKDSRKFFLKVVGRITRANCEGVFRPPAPENLMLGERFIKDSTNTKRLPYSGPIPFPSGRVLEKRTERYCNNKFVWFIAGHEERQKIIITKYTFAGDFIYSVRMTDPRTAENKLFGGMINDSVEVDSGYFYFYWAQDLPRQDIPSAGYPTRVTRFRFREPT